MRKTNTPFHTGSSTTKALIASVKRSKPGDQTIPRFSADQCRYCTKQHYSDECLKYKTVDDRKRQIRGSCFRCLREGHIANECKRNKTCVHCGEYNKHQISLCLKMFGERSISESSGVSLLEEVSDCLHASLRNHIVTISYSNHIIIHIRIPGSSKQNDTWQNMACNNVK